MGQRQRRVAEKTSGMYAATQNKWEVLFLRSVIQNKEKASQPVGNGGIKNYLPNIKFLQKMEPCKRSYTA